MSWPIGHDRKWEEEVILVDFPDGSFPFTGGIGGHFTDFIIFYALYFYQKLKIGWSEPFFISVSNSKNKIVDISQSSD